MTCHLKRRKGRVFTDVMQNTNAIADQLQNMDSTNIFFSDLNGRIMSLPINPLDIEKIIQKGVGFDGSSIKGYANVEQSDRLLLPDPESFQTVDFGDQKLGFFVGRIYNEHKKRAQIDPRAVLENIVEKVRQKFGWSIMVGPEHEFFLLDGNDFNEQGSMVIDDKAHTDKACYFQASPHDKGETVRTHILQVLEKCNIRFEKAHHEVAPSQHEINLEPLDPIRVADRTVLFTYVAQKIAFEHGYYVTFMPKPFNGQNRNALHIHLSMADEQGNNLFYESSDQHNLSDIARHFIGGVLKFARETSIVMASTLNSYKAYMVETEAPIIRGWGFRNRSSMIRVPYSDSEESMRIELRNPDPAGNIYLQLATLISMGIQGIEDKIECPRPDIGSTYKKEYGIKVWDQRFLPRCLYEALVEAEQSAFLKTCLGDKIYNNYMALKIEDWEDHRTHITPREHRKYLNI